MLHETLQKNIGKVKSSSEDEVYCTVHIADAFASHVFKIKKMLLSK